jgi:hypothetical protein
MAEEFARSRDSERKLPQIMKCPPRSCYEKKERILEEILKCWTMDDHERRERGIDKPTNATTKDFIKETGDKSAR